MATLTIDQNPSITDTIVFDLPTPDANGCFNSDPYKFDNVVIYYIQRDFASGNYNTYETKTYIDSELLAAEQAEALACNSPTVENLTNAKILRSIAESHASFNQNYYKESIPVQIIGNDANPAWFSGDPNNSLINHIEYDLDGNPLVGNFQYNWQPINVREGDYVICWTWTPNIAGSTLSAHKTFTLLGDTVVTTSLPSHQTDPLKYETLLNRYLPAMFREYISYDDLTPNVLNKFNNSLGMTFTFMENLVNQIVDLQDANSTHEALLPYLSNFFNIKLKTSDPTRWRGQIKRAIPLYKMKGTKKGLTEALEHAAINLIDITQQWEITSLSTFQEEFVFDGGKFYLNFTSGSSLAGITNLKLDDVIYNVNVSNNSGDAAETALEFANNFKNSNWKAVSSGNLVTITSRVKGVKNGSYSFSSNSTGINASLVLSEDFILNKEALPLDPLNFELWIRQENPVLPVTGTDWFQLDSTYVSFNTVNGVTTMNWIGDSLILNPIFLDLGDKIRVLYKYNYVANQNHEDYLRSLPLMDIRDDKSQIYPLKNWNTRVINEKDPMFSVLIPTRNPYFDFVKFGKIRTEFAYSENIYNMDEYNGSLRDSQMPCDIDREFLDPCFYCIGSTYNVDLEIENLSDDRILEAKEVLMENLPFDATLHTFNFVGNINEFMQSPIEEIQILIHYMQISTMLIGNNNNYFNRNMFMFNNPGVSRNDLADLTTVGTFVSGTVYNEKIIMFSPDVNLGRSGIANDGSALMTILSPSPLAGVYNVTDPEDNFVTLVTGNLVEPNTNCENIFANDHTLKTCAFTYEIKNRILDGESLCDVAVDKIGIFFDDNNSFPFLSIETLFDVGQGNAINPYRINISTASNTYDIADVNPDGTINLQNDGTLNTLSGNYSNVTYTLTDGSGNIVTTGTTGNLQIKNRARVTILNNALQPISNIVPLLGHFNINNDEYLITEYVPFTQNQFYISDYTSLDNNGINLRVFQKRVVNQVGYFSHRGLKLQLAGNYEQSLGIQNGANQTGTIVDNNNFKENYIFIINGYSYGISEIDGQSPPGFTTITLKGLENYYKTLDAGGTTLNLDIYKVSKKPISLPAHNPDYDFSYIDRSGKSEIKYTDQDDVVTTLNVEQNDNFVEEISQKEFINFKIEYQNGTSQEGEI